MKGILILCVISTMGVDLKAQHRLEAQEIFGTWELKINLNERLASENPRDANSLKADFEQGVQGFAQNVIDDMNIKMDFNVNGELRISANVFGVHEVEYTEWLVDRKGRLIIKEDTNKYGSRNKKIYVPAKGGFWMIDGDRLVAYKRKKERNQGVYMIKIDK